MSLLSNLKGYRSLIVNGLVFFGFGLAALHVMPNPIDLATANTLADNAETVANAADHLTDANAVSAGVVAAFALVNLVLRLFTTTPPGQKT